MANHKRVECRFLRRENTAHSRTTTPDFRRADFGLFREESHGIRP